MQTVVVQELSQQRGPAIEAQALYAETSESIELREQRKSTRRIERAGLTLPNSRPDKKDRRALAQLRGLDQSWQQAPDT